MGFPARARKTLNSQIQFLKCDAGDRMHVLRRWVSVS